MREKKPFSQHMARKEYVLFNDNIIRTPIRQRLDPRFIFVGEKFQKFISSNYLFLHAENTFDFSVYVFQAQKKKKPI